MTTTEEQLDFYLKNDPQFEAVLIGSGSPINTLRTWATDFLNRCKGYKPDDFIRKLLRILKDNPDEKLRRLSAIELCDNDMPGLADSTLNNLKTTLIFSLENENEKFISEKVCQAVSRIAPALLTTESGWPALLTKLYGWVMLPVRECFSVRNNPEKWALLILAQLAHNMGETLSPRWAFLLIGLSECFKPPQSLEVRFAALTAAINLMLYLERALNRYSFHCFVPSIMDTLTEALKCGEEEMAADALKLLIELVRMKPSVFHRQPVDVVELMVKIMEEDGYEEGPRHLAIEFVIQLVEARELAEGNLPLNSIIRLVAVLLKMFLETDDEDTGDTSTYAFYLEHLNKLLVSLGGDSILPVASGPEFQKSQIFVNMIKQFKKVILIIQRRLHEATSHSDLSPSCTVIILNRLLMSS